MSINYCTIGRDRIDGFCGNQRAKVLARLIHEAGHDIIVVPPTPTPRPSGGGAIIGGGFDFRPHVNVLQPGQRPWQRPELDKHLPQQEQPVITVRAEIFGFSGFQIQEVTNRIDFVTVRDLEINNDSEITVNITEMEIANVTDW